MSDVTGELTENVLVAGQVQLSTVTALPAGSGQNVLGAVVLLMTGWGWVDPLVGVLIGVWVLPRTWRLAGRAVRMQVGPPPTDPILPVDDYRQNFLSHQAHCAAPGVAHAPPPHAPPAHAPPVLPAQAASR